MQKCKERARSVFKLPLIFNAEDNKFGMISPFFLIIFQLT